MTLNLTILNPDSDYGRYYCVSKNEEGITRGEIQIHGNLVEIFRRSIIYLNHP